eukprot:1027960-Amphidinium_carterae.2
MVAATSSTDPAGCEAEASRSSTDPAGCEAEASRLGVSPEILRHTPREMNERQQMGKEDQAVLEDVPDGASFDSEYLYIVRRDAKAWTYRRPRKHDPFKIDEVIRRVTWCSRTGKILEDVMLRDTTDTWSMGQKLPAAPRPIVTKFWHSRRAEVPLPVIRRDEEPPAAPGLPVPVSLTADEWEQHIITHCPYNAACEHCVKGRARGELHRRREPESPEVELDWSYWTSVGTESDKPSPGALVSLTAVHCGSGMLMSSACEQKGETRTSNNWW